MSKFWQKHRMALYARLISGPILNENNMPIPIDKLEALLDTVYRESLEDPSVSISDLAQRELARHKVMLTDNERKRFCEDVVFPCVTRIRWSIRSTSSPTPLLNHPVAWPNHINPREDRPRGGGPRAPTERVQDPA